MTDHPLGPIKLALKDGEEPFTQAGESKGFDLLEFWRWSTSDLVDTPRVECLRSTSSRRH